MPAEESRETWQCDPGSWGAAGRQGWHGCPIFGNAAFVAIPRVTINDRKFMGNWDYD